MAEDDMTTRNSIKFLQEYFDDIRLNEEAETAWCDVKQAAQLGAAVREAVLDVREPRHGDRIGEMHPAMRDRLGASELDIDTGVSLLSRLFNLALGRKLGD